MRKILTPKHSFVNPPKTEFALELSAAEKGMRLDLFLKSRLNQFSRSQIQKWVRQGCALCDGVPAPSAHILKGTETVSLSIPAEEISLAPDPSPLQILYEDSHILVLDKPAGMATHPSGGNFRGSLANAVAYYLRQKKVPPSEMPGGMRLGIVHRLDKDTSGVLVLAKNSAALQDLSEQFQRREVKKVYRAIVCGEMKMRAGEIEGPIGRDPESGKMAVQTAGRQSHTDFKVLRAARELTYIEVYPRTGRTHQIRVHLSKIGHPVLGDAAYGTIDPEIPRQMLHAYQITIRHPAKKKHVRFVAPLPEDFQKALKKLKPGGSAKSGRTRAE